MPKVLFVFLLLQVCTRCSAQCSFPLRLNTTDQCLGTATLDVSTSQTLSKIVWTNNGAAVQTVNATPLPLNGTVVAGGVPPGSGTNGMMSPWDVSVDAAGNIYVVVEHQSEVLKFPPNSVSGTYGVIVAGGFPGGGPDQLSLPINLFVDATGNVYVSDHDNSRVMKWAPGATSGIVVAGGNGPGSAANQLSFPYGVSVDGAGNVYVVDGNNYRVQKWAPGATIGVTVAGGNGQGSAANQLNEPTGMCMDAQGNIYIAEFNGNRVSKWAPGATSGVTVAGGTRGAGPGQLDGPYDVAIDAAGNLYVADANNNRVQKWAPGATSGVTVAGGNGEGPATNQLAFPTGVTVDAQGNVYVADMRNNRVEEWGQRTSITTNYVPITPGTYTATVTDINGCSVSSNSIVVHPVVTPSLAIAADATTICSGSAVTFSASPVSGGSAPAYQWQVNGVGVGSNSGIYSSSSLASGDKISCLMTSNEYCTTAATAASNIVAMTVYPAVTPPSVSIATTTPAVCSSIPVSFTADVNAGGNIPVYQWAVNGASAGTNLPSFTLTSPSDGDVVTCRVSVGENVCTASAASNSLAVVVHPDPSIAPGKTIAITGGQAQVLDPQISGDIVTYLWTPSDGLSDNSVRNPVADPIKSTTYLLKVTTAENCSASQEIKVNVFRDLVLPSGFTPNNDGHNDVFYVLAGPPGSQIGSLSVFNKWGEMVFQVRDAAPGDPAFGWNGTYKGSPAPEGGYVYFAVIRMADGSLQRLQGTILLVR